MAPTASSLVSAHWLKSDLQQVRQRGFQPVARLLYLALASVPLSGHTCPCLLLFVFASVL